MGLLDDILGQLEGNADRRIDAPATTAGMAPLLTALLPVALAMLNGNAQADRQSDRRTGGLGGLLGQVLGAGGGQSNGLAGVLGQLERAGFGDQVRSWVGTGQNQPIPPAGIEQVFGDGALEEIARRAGVSPADAARGLSQLMPELVDRVTPNGQVPDSDALVASVGALAKRFGLA